MRTSYIPKNYRSIMPYLRVSGGLKAVEFYQKALGAKLVGKPFITPDGKLGHAEMKIGDSKFGIADDMSVSGDAGTSQSCKCLSQLINIYVRDVDKQIDLAIAAGAKQTMPVSDRFYGDRSGQIEDPYGHLWEIATHKEDVSPSDMRRRAAEAFSKAGH